MNARPFFALCCHRQLALSDVRMHGNRTKVNADVFMPLFSAWQNHQLCHITYDDSRGNTTERDFEPHALIFFEGIWYSKGFCHVRNEMRTLVVSRIKSIHLQNAFFEPKQDIVKTVTEDLIFDSEIIPEAIIHCDDYLTKFIETRPLHPEQAVTIKPDGTSEVVVKSIPKYRLITWIMHQCGRVELIAPKALRSEILENSNLIAKKHCIRPVYPADPDCADTSKPDKSRQRPHSEAHSAYHRPTAEPARQGASESLFHRF